MISTSIPIELRCYGPCRYFEAWIGYVMYQMLQTSAFTSGMSIIVTFYLKFEAVRSFEFSYWKMSITIFGFHVPIFISLAMEVIMVITQALPLETRQRYSELNGNLTEYAIIGALSLKTAPSLINFSLISGAVLISPLVSFLFRHKILARINSHMDKSSQMKKTQNKVFVKGLTIQATLPLIFYVPIFGMYFYCILTHDEIFFQQYTMTIIPALPAFFDPLLTLYFVTPYRKRVKIWMRLETESKTMPVITTQIN